VIGLLLLVVAVVALATVGDRVLPSSAEPFSPLAVVTVLFVISLVLALGRLPLVFWWPTRDGDRSPFGYIPQLHTELGNTIDGYKHELGLYEEEFKQAGIPEERYTTDLKQARFDLDLAEKRLRERSYVSAFRRYYQAQEQLIDIAPELDVVDEQMGRNRDRVSELIDQGKMIAAGIEDSESRSAIESHLTAAGDGSTTYDLSEIKNAFRRIHEVRLRTLSSYLRRRKFLRFVNSAMLTAIGVVTLSAIGFVLAQRWELVTLPGEQSATDGRLLEYGYIPVVFWFGALGAVLNIFRRFGRTGLFEEASAPPELPDDLIAKPGFVARILWGSIAAFVVFLFTSLSGTFDPAFVILTAIVAGFSEQLLENVLSRQEERVLPPETKGSTAGDSSLDGTAAITYQNGRMTLHGVPQESFRFAMMNPQTTVGELLATVDQQHGRLVSQPGPLDRDGSSETDAENETSRERADRGQDDLRDET
jgi:hypothetical protein